MSNKDSVDISDHARKRYKERTDIDDNWTAYAKWVLYEGKHLNRSENHDVKRWSDYTELQVYKFRRHVFLFDKKDDRYVLVTILPQSAVADQLVNYRAKHVRNSHVVNNPKNNDAEVEGWSV